MLYIPFKKEEEEEEVCTKINEMIDKLFFDANFIVWFGLYVP